MRPPFLCSDEQQMKPVGPEHRGSESYNLYGNSILVSA
jgi:hypothetical protein